jgi:guanosine-3',5'-bis(diphosphate) 3'-pyrophosphohydrolase
VRDVTHSPPDWPLERRIEYLDWAEQVANGCHGANANLEYCFYDVITQGRALLSPE